MCIFETHVDRQVGDLESLGLQLPARVQHALVLRLRGDHVSLLPAIEAGDALDGDVVALGGAGGEHDLLGVGADQGRDLRKRALKA